MSQENIKEVLSRIKEKLKSKTFIKAIGKLTARDIEILVNYIENTLQSCKISLNVDYVEELISKYYTNYIKLKFLIREFIRILFTEYLHVIKKIYPILPEKWREILSNLMYEEKLSDDKINFIVNEILKGFNDYERELKNLLEIVSEVKKRCLENQ